MVGAGFLGGIGFTMALFIANLALLKESLDAAKIGILSASVDRLDRGGGHPHRFASTSRVEPLTTPAEEIS